MSDRPSAYMFPSTDGMRIHVPKTMHLELAFTFKTSGAWYYECGIYSEDGFPQDLVIKPEHVRANQIFVASNRSEPPAADGEVLVDYKLPGAAVDRDVYLYAFASGANPLTDHSLGKYSTPKVEVGKSRHGYPQYAWTDFLTYRANANDRYVQKWYKYDEHEDSKKEGTNSWQIVIVSGFDTAQDNCWRPIDKGENHISAFWNQKDGPGNAIVVEGTMRN